MDESKALEREAIALWNQYGLFLPAPVKAFMRKLAAFNGWAELGAKIK